MAPSAPVATTDSRREEGVAQKVCSLVAGYFYSILTEVAGHHTLTTK